MRIIQSILLTFGAATLLIACVPARKYSEMQMSRDECRSELENLKKEHEAGQSRNKELESKAAVDEKQIAELVRDSLSMGKQLRQLKEQYDKINELNEILSSKSSTLLNQASSENQKLLLELDATREMLQKREDAVKVLEKNLNDKEASLNALNTSLKDRETRVTELESLIAQQEAASNALKKKVSDALLGFKDKGLSVEQKNGKVYVKMEAKLLFPSGSTKIDEEGKKALAGLAKAIENEADMEIIVEGHTDTDKISSATIPRDNWELSVLRATEVIKYMVSSSSLKPQVLSAAGRSEYHPVNVSDKARNRRIEIILQPRLDELYNILEE